MNYNTVIILLKISGPILRYIINYSFQSSGSVHPVIFSICCLKKENTDGWLISFHNGYITRHPVIFIIFRITLPHVWLLLPIVPFYLFCFLIKFSVDEWLREYNWEQQLIEQRKEWEEKKKEGLL